MRSILPASNIWMDRSHRIPAHCDRRCEWTLPFRAARFDRQVSSKRTPAGRLQTLGTWIVWRTDRLGMVLDYETRSRGRTYAPPRRWKRPSPLVGRVCRRRGVCGSAWAPAARMSKRFGARRAPGGNQKNAKAGWAPKLVHGEAVRQVNAQAPRRLAPARIATSVSICIDAADVTDLFANSRYTLLATMSSTVRERREAAARF